MKSQAQLQDKCRGMLVGLAVGDALGAQVEFEFSEDIRDEQINQMHAGGTHNLPKGAWTDDTSMALCLADSLLERGGYDSFNAMEKYLKWRDEGYRSSIGVCCDIGNQTDQALERFNNGDPVIAKDESRETSAGNGGIMRLAPTIIATANQPIRNAIRLAKISSRETHYSEEADAGAEIFGVMLWQALRLNDKNEIVAVAKYSTSEVFDDILSRINQAQPKNSENELKDLGGYVVDSLKIAVWGFLNFDTFRDGMLAVIKLGGDTDTNAAIYGQLAGVYYGYEAIPKEWRDSLFQEKEIKELADKLLAMKECPMIQTRFEED